MLGVEVPDGLFFAIAPVILIMVVGLMTWIVREMGRVTVNNTELEGRMKNAEDDIRDIKGYLGWGRPPAEKV